MVNFGVGAKGTTTLSSGKLESVDVVCTLLGLMPIISLSLSGPKRSECAGCGRKAGCQQEASGEGDCGGYGGTKRPVVHGD